MVTSDTYIRYVYVYMVHLVCIIYYTQKCVLEFFQMYVKLSTLFLQFVCSFHIATSFTSKDLIRLILEIYGGIPGPYELYHCGPDTTSDELSLFYKRAMKFP